MITFDNLVHQVGDKLGIGYREAVQRIREAKRAGDPELNKVADLDNGLMAASRLLPTLGEFGESALKGGLYDLARSAAYPLTWIDPEIEKRREGWKHEQEMLPSRLGETAGELASIAVPWTAGTKLLRLLGVTSKLEVLGRAMVGLPSTVKKAVEAGTVTAEQLDKYGPQIARASKWAKRLETGATMGTYGALSGNTMPSALRGKPAGVMDIAGEAALWTAGAGVAGKLGNLARRLPFLRPTEEMLQTPAGREAIQYLARKGHKSTQQVVEEFRNIGQLVPKLTEEGLPPDKVSALLDSMSQKNIDDLAVLASGPTDEGIYRSMVQHPERGFFTVEPPQTQPVATLTTQLMEELGGRIAPKAEMFGLPPIPGRGPISKVNPFMEQGLGSGPIYDDMGRLVAPTENALARWVPDEWMQEMELAPTTAPAESIRPTLPEMPWLREAVPPETLAPTLPETMPSTAPIERTRPFISPVTKAETTSLQTPPPNVMALPESLRIKQLDTVPQSVELGLSPTAGNYIGQRYVMSTHPEAIGARQAVTLRNPLVVNVPVNVRDPEEAALKMLMGRRTGGDGRILEYFDVSSGWLPSQVRSQLLQEFVARRAKDAGFKSLVYRSAVGPHMDQAVDISGKITTSHAEMKKLIKFYKDYNESKVVRNLKPPEQSLVEDYGVDPATIAQLAQAEIPITAAPEGAFGKQVLDEVAKLTKLKPQGKAVVSSATPISQTIDALHRVLTSIRGLRQGQMAPPEVLAQAKELLTELVEVPMEGRLQTLTKEIVLQFTNAITGQTGYNSPLALVEEVQALLKTAKKAASKGDKK